MDTFNQLTLTLFPGLIIAAVTSYLTVHLSLRRFYSERWWERKAHAYSTILESMYMMRAYPTRLLRRTEQGRDVSKEIQQELQLNSQKGYDEINKAIAIGTFIISDKAASYLSDFQKEYKNVDDTKPLFDVMESHIAIIDNYLNIIRICAKKDLRVP